MTEDLPLTPEEADAVLAAELALGLLPADEAEAAAARLAAEPAFAARLRLWQERLAGMSDDLVPVLPPARTRQRIRERLGHVAAPLSRTPDSRSRWGRRPWWLVLLLAAALALAALALAGVL